VCGYGMQYCRPPCQADAFEKLSCFHHGRTIGSENPPLAKLRALSRWNGLPYVENFGGKAVGKAQLTPILRSVGGTATSPTYLSIGPEESILQRIDRRKWIRGEK
jgi:hypothetical protein